MRLIDADALYDKMMGTPTDLHFPSWFASMVKAAPTISERDDGYWEPNEPDMDPNGYRYGYHCSACMRPVPKTNGPSRYCCYCGAKMKYHPEVKETK